MNVDTEYANSRLTKGTECLYLLGTITQSIRLLNISATLPPAIEISHDRYYFNLHGSSDEVMTIFGLGQYPNLGVTDAFIAVGTKEKHRVVRASQPLEDRSSMQVGPISTKF